MWNMGASWMRASRSCMSAIVSPPSSVGQGGLRLDPDRLGAPRGVRAAGRRDAAVNRLDDLEDADLDRGAAEGVAALDARAGSGARRRGAGRRRSAPGSAGGCRAPRRPRGSAPGRRRPRCASSVRASTAERLFSVMVISGTPENPATDREFSRRSCRSDYSSSRSGFDVALAGDDGLVRAALLGAAPVHPLEGVDPAVQVRDHELVDALGRVEDHPRPAAARGHPPRGDREALDLPDVVEDDLAALGAQRRCRGGSGTNTRRSSVT